VFGEYQATEPSRFLDEIPSELMEKITPAVPAAYGTFAHQHYEFRTNPYGRGGRGRGGGRWREESPTYDYENEDQSAGGSAVRPGMRVRHAQFGVGNVIAVEAHTDDIKVTVRFNTVGVKKLLAKFAKLEPA
jgi:DNA helicase-2/ATP-dependent DNA helicase PcrA